MENRVKGFCGISFPFRFDGRGGVVKSTTSPDDFSHIDESIAQILLTKVLERPMELQFGSEVHKQLFRNPEDATEIGILEFYIKEALEKFEPRIEVIGVNVYTTTDPDSGETIWMAEIDRKVLRYLKQGVTTVNLGNLSFNSLGI